MNRMLACLLLMGINVDLMCACVNVSLDNVDLRDVWLKQAGEGLNLMSINVVQLHDEVNLMLEKDKLMLVNINLMDEDGGYLVAILIKSDQIRSNPINFDQIRSFFHSVACLSLCLFCR
ncbi:hypothetical protein ACFS7Y_21470 [Sphingobacterium bambusae]|uniref:Uncharacterized protein n=2 Tax=Sphingobacterium bambusae TaxID=662858 RepID=A0ABW6BNI4_9SPHI